MAGLRHQRGSARGDGRGIEKAGYRSRRRRRDLARYRRFRIRRAGRYRLARESRDLDSEAMVALLLGWVERYPIVSIEDPLAEDDEAGLIAFTKAAGRASRSSATTSLSPMPTGCVTRQTVGACNAVLIKPNQAGTVTETRAALRSGDSRRLGRYRFGPFGRDRGCLDRPSRGRLGGEAAQGRLLHPLRADGEVERGVAHRRGDRRRLPAATVGVSMGEVAGIDPAAGGGRA